ncbi:MAG TPA: hypothetical protein VK831_03750 [Candidatus Deferrimicrobiaceae bacterium]|nr:hypothetical protein [Candidatus Deferrimicrobiaceae bacterium]
MPGDSQRVVILYAHPLLGEGLARMLGEDPRLVVTAVHVEDLESAKAVLRDAPDVVVVERAASMHAIDLLALAPSALLIDVGLDAGPSWAYHRDEISPQPDEILHTIRRCTAAGNPSVVRRRRPGQPHRTAPAPS